MPPEVVHPEEVLAQYIGQRLGGGDRGRVLQDLVRGRLIPSRPDAVNHLAMSLLALIDHALYITSYLVSVGHPPTPQGREEIARDRAERPVPSDVFQLHEDLRDTVFRMSSLRLMIQRQKS